MKVTHVSEDILPIGAFKTHASRVLRQLKKDQRPIVITQNGKPAGVLIPPEEFDRLSEQDRFIAAVHDGLADADAGRVVDDAQLSRELEEALGAPDEP